MGVRQFCIVAGLAGLAVATASFTAGVADAGDPAPPADPVVTITDSVVVGGTIEASMECHWVDPSVELEPLIPTWNMVAPDGTSVVEDDVFGDAGTVMASWAASQLGEWGLFVTCGEVTEVFTSIVTPVATTPAPSTPAPTTDPPAGTAPDATLPATGAGGGSSLLASALVVAGLAAVIVARRRPT